MNTVYKCLTFLNLIDKERRLSLTNVAVVIITVKLAFLSSFTLTEVGAFMVAILNYGYKRRENNRLEKSHTQQGTKAIEDKIVDIESKLSALSIQAGIRRR